MSLELVPVDFSEANAFVEQHHRHHGATVGAKFCVGVANDGEVCGVAIVGRPVARRLDDGWTLEVTRVCTDGTKNACSALYAAAWRAGKALGYKRMITYVLDTERGSSVKAAGWKLIGEAGGGSWNCQSRPRVDKHPTQKKMRWEAV